MHDHPLLRSWLRTRQGRGKPDKPNPPPPPNAHDPQIPPPPPPPNSPSSTVTQASSSDPTVVASYSSQFSSQINPDSNPTPTSSYLNPNSGGSPSQTTAFAVVSLTGTSVSHSSSSTAQKSDSGATYGSPSAASTGTASKVGVNIAIITGVILAIVFIVIAFRVMCVVLRRPDHGPTSNRFVHDYPFAPHAQFQRIRTQSSAESFQTDMDTTSSPCVTIPSVRRGS